MNNETFSVSGSGKLADANVALDNQGNVVGKTLSSLDSLALGSSNGTNTANANNYNTLSAGNSSVTIDKAKLTAITGTKTYDGLTGLNVGSNGSLTLSGVANESATLTAGTVELSGKNVSPNGQSVTTLTTSGLKTDGKSTLNLDNYDVSDLSAVTSNKIDVTKARLTSVTGTKAFDGTTTIDPANLTIVGVNGEEFTSSSAGIAASSSPSTANNKVTNVNSLQLKAKNNAAVELLSNYDLNNTPNSNQVIFNAQQQQRVVTRAPVVPSSSSNSASRVRTDSTNNFQLASAEDSAEGGDEFCSADHLSAENCECEEVSSSHGVLICMSTNSTQKISARH